MDLLRNSCSPDAFLFYTSKLDSMASSLETLLTRRRAKKAARFRGIIDHSFTDNSLNQLVNNTNASNNDMSCNVTHNASNSTVTRKRSRRKTKPTNIQLDHSSVINLSSSSLSADEISVLARGLTFCPTPRHINWWEVSADIRPVGWFLPGWVLFRLKRTFKLTVSLKIKLTVTAEDFLVEVDGGVILMP